MKLKKSLNQVQIANKIRLGNDFTVGTERERKLALNAAKVLEIDIITRADPKNGFTIFIPSEVPN